MGLVDVHIFIRNYIYVSNIFCCSFAVSKNKKLSRLFSFYADKHKLSGRISFYR